MSPREMSADHLWSLTIPVSPTGPKLTPKVTPYGADARRDSWTPLDAKVRDSLSKNAPLDAIGRGSERREPTFQSGCRWFDPSAAHQ